MVRLNTLKMIAMEREEALVKDELRGPHKLKGNKDSAKTNSYAYQRILDYLSSWWLSTARIIPRQQWYKPAEATADESEKEWQNTNQVARSASLTTSHGQNIIFL